MKRELDILSRAEVEKLLDACPTNYAGARIRAMIAIQFRTGMRPGEVRNLEFGDVSEVDGWLVARIRHPKGHSRKRFPAAPRDLLVDRRTEGYYREWLRYRGTSLGPLFCARHGGRISAQYHRRELQRIARRTTITKRCWLHGLRHAFAHEFAAERKDFGELSGALGHRSVKTTLLYCSAIGANPRVISAMREREW